MRFGGWWPDYVTRLVQKNKTSGWKDELHEVLEVNGKKEALKGVLYHLSHRGITWILNKSINYTQTEARLRFENGHPPVVWWRLFRVMLTEFWYRLIAKSGWRDGIVGWIEAIYQTFNMFIIYIRLWEMQKGKTMEQIYQDLDKQIVKNGF